MLLLTVFVQHHASSSCLVKPRVDGILNPGPKRQVFRKANEVPAVPTRRGPTPRDVERVGKTTFGV